MPRNKGMKKQPVAEAPKQPEQAQPVAEAPKQPEQAEAPKQPEQTETPPVVTVTVNEITVKEREAAKKLLDMGRHVAEVSGGFFTFAVNAIIEGCTFEGLEAAEPALKEVIAYRTAKSTIRKALKHGVKLMDGHGKAKNKHDLAKESRQPVAEETGGETTSTPSAGMTIHYSDVHAMLKDCFKLLSGDAKLRAGYVVEVRTLAKQLANEEATARSAAEIAAAAIVTADADLRSAIGSTIAPFNAEVIAEDARLRAEGVRLAA